MFECVLGIDVVPLPVWSCGTVQPMMLSYAICAVVRACAFADDSTESKAKLGEYSISGPCSWAKRILMGRTYDGGTEDGEGK